MKKQFLFLILIFSTTFYAQNDGDIEKNFGSFAGFNGPVNNIKEQTDGKILIGGGFSKYRGLPSPCIIRLNNDGTKDPLFNHGSGIVSSLGREVKAIAVQTNGKILIGGYFDSYNGSTVSNFIRLNSDGTIDNTFQTTAVSQIGPINCIKIQNDGKIIVGGNYNIIRLNASGSLDTTFNIGTGLNNAVHTIETQPDGKILAGGYFNLLDNPAGPDYSYNKIIRFNTDGSRDTTFNIGTGFNNTNDVVFSIAIQSDGKILVGGRFTSYKGLTNNSLIRLNSDGTKDTMFNTGTGINNTVHSIAIQPNGKILIGGAFSSYNSITIRDFVQLSSNGAIENITDFSNSSNYIVKTFLIQTDGKILVGGEFDSFNGIGDKRITRLNPDLTRDNTFNNNTGFSNFNDTSNTVNTIVKYPDGKFIVGGFFISYNGKSYKNLIRFNADGTIDNTFNTNGGFNVHGSVKSIAIQDDGKILVGGTFISFNGISQKRICRLNSDGTLDLTFNTGNGFDNIVNTIAIQNDGKILVGGEFISYNDIINQRIVRLNSDGSKDTSVFNGTVSSFIFNDDVYSIKIQSDGKILVGGDFTYYLLQQENRIIRLNVDGTKDITFNTGVGFNDNVYSITIQTNGKIIIGGEFTTYKNITEKNIIILNSNGTKDSSFNIGTGFNNNVYSVSTQIDGKILVGGSFTSFNGITQNKITRLSSSGNIDTTFNTTTGFDNDVKSIVVFPDGNILIGGSFNLYQNNIDSINLITLNGNSVLSNVAFTNTNAFSLYPNPVKDNLNIQYEKTSKILSVKIYDLQGKLVSDTKDKSVNVSHFTSGLYIIKITTEEGEFTKKFIKE